MRRRAGHGLSEETMRAGRRSALRLLTLLVFATARSAGADEPATCVIDIARPTLRAGDHLQAGVRICNASAETVRLPCNTEGSELRETLPLAWWSVDGVPAPRYPVGCGTFNGLAPEDVFAVAAGDCFNPFARGCEPSHFGAHFVFACPGRHVVTFHYATTPSASGARWIAMPETIGGIPKLSIECSAEVVVHAPGDEELPPLPLPVALGMDVDDARAAAVRLGLDMHEGADSAHRQLHVVVPLRRRERENPLESSSSAVVTYSYASRSRRAWSIEIQGAGHELAGRIGALPISASIADATARLGRPSAACVQQEFGAFSQACLWLRPGVSYLLRSSNECAPAWSLQAFATDAAPADFVSGWLRMMQGRDVQESDHVVGGRRDE